MGHFLESGGEIRQSLLRSCPNAAIGCCPVVFSEDQKKEEEEEEEPLAGKDEEERRIAEMGRPMLGDHVKLEVIIEESYEFKVRQQSAFQVLSGVCRSRRDGT